MDQRLHERLTKWHVQIGKVRDADAVYLELEASEKSFYSELFLAAEGKSIAEKEAKAYACQEWKNYSAGLAQARSRFNHEKRILDLHQKAFDAEYLTYKIEADGVRKAV